MDKLLKEVKDFSVLKKYLEAINQTTDDYLYTFDFSEGKLEFFAPIEDAFKVEETKNDVISFEQILPVVHPADKAALIASLTNLRSGNDDSHNIDFRMFNKKGETVWINSRGKILHDEDGKARLLIGRMSEEALRHLYDPMTGLWNKTKLREDLKQRLSTGKGWLMILEIANLTGINLVHGREHGNRLLCEIAEIFESIEHIEKAYHPDYSTFAVILKDCDDLTAEQIYGNISRMMEEKCFICAGIVPIDNKMFIDSAQLIDSALITLRNASQNTTGQAAFFSKEDIGKKITELTLLEELNESVQNNFEGFELYYQPQIKSGSYEIHGVEALIRYTSNKYGRVFPTEFIPILEQSGLIVQVGMWVLEQALEKCREWRKSLPDLQAAVNFSSVQFEDEGLADKVFEALKKAQLPGSALTIEITESIQLSTNKQYYDIIKDIRAYGVRFAIDDFGTGYSNLGYLKQLDVNEIKIDRSFVTEIERDTYNYRLISNLLEFTKTNSIDTCLEGIETAKEFTVLEPLQADFLQGYLFDKPCTPDDIRKKYISDSSEEYQQRMKAIEEINRYKEQFGGIHFDPKNILHENGVGLWIARIDKKDGRHELHADDVMERVLGLEEKLLPGECFGYWHSRILPEYLEYVDNAMEMMVTSGSAVQLEYLWSHPTKGKVTVRSSGIRTQYSDSVAVLEGYHRILDDVEGT